MLFRSNEGLELVEQDNGAKGKRYVVEDADGNELFTIPLRGCLLDTRFRNGQLRFREQNSKSYSVGTRTIVDVLDATTTLYNAKQELANARYNYLINQLNIKSALGTLNEQDLLALNNALSKPVSTNPENVAPQTPEQNAIADGYAPDSPAPVVQQTSARTTTSNGHNPFRN